MADSEKTIEELRRETQRGDRIEEETIRDGDENTSNTRESQIEDTCCDEDPDDELPPALEPQQVLGGLVQVLVGRGTITKEEDQFIMTGEWPDGEKPDYSDAEYVTRYGPPEDVTGDGEEVTHRIPTELLEEIDQMAERLDVDRGDAINMLVDRGLKGL